MSLVAVELQGGVLLHETIVDTNRTTVTSYILIHLVSNFSASDVSTEDVSKYTTSAVSVNKAGDAGTRGIKKLLINNSKNGGYYIDVAEICE